MKGLFRAAFLVMLSAPSFGAAQDFTEDAYYRAQLSGWDGLVFTCANYGAKQTAEICRLLGIEFDFLATTAGVSAVNCYDCNTSEWVLRSRNANLTLPLHIRMKVGSTEEEFRVGGFISMTVEGDFFQAMCIGLDVCRKWELPSSYVIYFAKDAAFSGEPNQEMITVVSKTGERFLKEFLTVFVRASKPD